MGAEQRAAKSTKPGTRKSVLYWLLGLGGLMAGIAVALEMERRVDVSPVARGRALAIANGCFACHGNSEGDQRANFRQLASGSWKPKSIPTLWENGIDSAEVLHEWIAKGVTADEAENHKRLFIQMPAYADFMTPGEIDAVSAYILSDAVRLSQGAGSAKIALPKESEIAQLPPDRLLVLGDALSRQQGCYQCHGELGQGGIENPASFKNAIPGFFGADFRDLTDGGDRDEILYWIDHGRGRAIESGLTGTLAKRFLDRQAIDMPAYRDHLSSTEKTILTEYLLYLNKAGPLTAKELERILKLLSETTAE